MPDTSGFGKMMRKEQKVFRKFGIIGDNQWIYGFVVAFFDGMC